MITGIIAQYKRLTDFFEDLRAVRICYYGNDTSDKAPALCGFSGA